MNSNTDDLTTHVASQPVLIPVDPEAQVDDEFVLIDKNKLEGVALHMREDDARAQETNAAPRGLHGVPSAESLYSTTPPVSPTVSHTSSQLAGMSRLQPTPPRRTEHSNKESLIDDEVEACILRKKVTTLEIQNQDLQQSMETLFSQQQSSENERSLQLEDLSAACEKLCKDLDDKIAVVGNSFSEECSASRDFLQAELKKSNEALELHKKISSQQHASLVAIQGAKSQRIGQLEDALKQAEAAHGLAVSELQQRLQKSEQAISELSELTQKLSQKLMESELDASHRSQRPSNRRAQHQQAQRHMHPRPEGSSVPVRRETPSSGGHEASQYPFIRDQHVQYHPPEMDEGLGLFKWLA